MVTGKLYQDRNGVLTCDKKILPWFGVGYDSYPTHWLFSISSPRLRDKKHTIRWIQIVSIPKPTEILYLFIAKTAKRSSNLPFSLCKVYAHIDQKKPSFHSVTHPANKEGTPNNNSDWIWILSLVVVLVLCAFIGLLLIYRRRKSKLMFYIERNCSWV